MPRMIVPSRTTGFGWCTWDRARPSAGGCRLPGCRAFSAVRERVGRPRPGHVGPERVMLGGKSRRTTLRFGPWLARPRAGPVHRSVVGDKPARYSPAGALADDTDGSAMRIAVRMTVTALVGCLLAGGAGGRSAPPKSLAGVSVRGAAAPADTRAARAARAQARPRP